MSNAIVGQEKAVSLLSKYLLRGSVPPALLFAGYTGVGKMKLAVEFARALNCEVSQNRVIGAACDCRSCTALKDGNHPSVIVVDENYHRNIVGKETSGETTGIDSVRAVQKVLSLKLTHGRKIVVIVDSAQNLSREAAGAFLKTLEEPSSDACLILLVPSVKTLPRTVVSRCQTIFFRRLKGDEIAAIIRKLRPDFPEFSRDVLKIFSSAGSVSKALDIIDNYDYYLSLKVKFRKMEIDGKDFKKDSAAAAFLNYLALSTREDFIANPSGKLYIREALLDAMKLLSAGVNRNMLLARLRAKLYLEKE